VRHTASSARLPAPRRPDFPARSATGRPLFRPLPRCSLQCVCGLPPGENRPDSGICRCLRGRKIKGLRLRSLRLWSRTDLERPCSFQGTFLPLRLPAFAASRAERKRRRFAAPARLSGHAARRPAFAARHPAPFSAVPSGVKTAALPALFPPEAAWSFPAFSGHALPPFPPA